MRISQTIKAARRRKGLTQGELAEIIDRSPMMVAKYEWERSNPPLEVLERIFNALEIKLVIKEGNEWLYLPVKKQPDI